MDKGERHAKQEGPVLSSEAELPGVSGAVAAVASAGAVGRKVGLPVAPCR